MANTESFNKEIDHRKKQAKGKYIDITSGELNKYCEGVPGTITTCCNAMIKSMLEGDEIIQKPTGKTGYGTRLIIRYFLHDLDTRRPIHNRKRGRPVGAKNTKTTQFNIESWLKDKDLSYEIIHGNFHVQGEFGPWIIYNNFSNDLSTALFQIARMYDTSINKYSLLTKKELVLKRWKKISEEFKKDLNLSLLYVEDDTITEY